VAPSEQYVQYLSPAKQSGKLIQRSADLATAEENWIRFAQLIEAKSRESVTLPVKMTSVHPEMISIHEMYCGVRK
jgi:hypothetical protein